ncbi:TRAP transporter large permease [Chachezhania sediminis]|uniref:TRAP transporter large permease n=1 Tax=Chachezhania sediminis TaxID=2599291 RepID=UPI00131A63DD|nr:TRAP transporter large permease subunit [Chachezhania sediminis]
MTPLLVGVAALVIVLVMIAARIPIAVCLTLVSFAGIYLIIGWRPAMSMISSVPYSFAASWTLSSVPMFLMMGYLAFHSGMTRGLFDAARVALGRMPGGLAVASLVGSGGFAAVTGSSVACAASVGRIAIPEMLREGYNVRTAAGAVAAGGTVGALIPPSIVLIIYGVQAEVSINALFLGGLVVGSITVLLYVLAVQIIAWRRPEDLPRGRAVAVGRRRDVLLQNWPLILLIGIVFGGLFSGVFTATEAGAVGVFLTFLIGVVRGKMTRAHFLESCSDTLLACGSLFAIAVGANMFTRLLALSGLSNATGDMIGALGIGVFGLLVIMCAVYLLLGMFLDPVGAMLLTLPLFLPLIESHGIDKIWFGLLLAKLLEMGMITPPVGLNVFVIHSVAKDRISLEQVFRGVVPFLAMDALLVVGLIAYQQLV